jgi:hypothetical protein
MNVYRASFSETVCLVAATVLPVAEHNTFCADATLFVAARAEKAHPKIGSEK